LPYSGPSDKDLPKHIKAMSAHQREVFVAAFNGAYSSRLEETGDKAEAERYAYAVATAAAKKAKEKKKMSKEMRFEAVCPLFKAREEGGKMFVSMLASSDTLDKSRERVAQEFIEKMRQQAEAGEVELLENHQATIPIGKSAGVVDPAGIWEEAQKAGVKASGPTALFAPEFELDPEHPLSEKVFKSVLEGRAAWQASIGGKAIGEKVYDPEAGGVVRILRPGMIDHVALTRKGKAANPDTMMFGAVMKSQEWDEIGEPKEKANERDIREAIRTALNEKNPGRPGEVEPTWVESLESIPEEGDAVISTKEGLFLIHYKIGEDGKAELGEERPAKQQWVERQADEESLEKVEVSNRSWSEVDKTKLPRPCFLINDSENRSEWKLPVYEGAGEKDEEGRFTERGALNANGVRAALAMVGGARTGEAMSISAEVKAKLDRLAKAAGIERESEKAEGGTETLAEAAKELSSTVDAVIANLEAQRGLGAAEVEEIANRVVEAKLAAKGPEPEKKPEGEEGESGGTPASEPEKAQETGSGPEAQTEKAGRRISAASGEELKAAMESMLAAMGKLQSLLGEKAAGDDSKSKPEKTEKAAPAMPQADSPRRAEDRLAELEKRIAALEGEPDPKAKVPAKPAAVVEKTFDANPEVEMPDALTSALSILKEAKRAGDPRLAAAAEEIAKRAMGIEMFRK